MRCVICDCEHKTTMYVCKRCMTKWNLAPKYADWPAWLQMFVDMEQVQRNEDAHIAAYIDPTDERWIEDADGNRHTHALPMNA